MASLKLNHIYKIYSGNVTAVSDFCLDIEDKEFIVLVGPSGCGKSTTLRMVAGLEEISEGELYIGDRLVNDVAPKDRDIAMVFQNYALYPHMTVMGNICFPLETQRVPKAERIERANEIAKLVHVDMLMNRKPSELSGGEQQRVSIARALAKNPKLLLCDEPTGALDYQTGKAILKLLQDMCREKGMTVIVITHNSALTPMADRVIHIKNGTVSAMELNTDPTPVEEIEW